MAAKKEKKPAKSPSAFGRLIEYAGQFRALTYLSLILSALSSVLALMPFVYLWRTGKCWRFSLTFPGPRGSSITDGWPFCSLC